jgi:hypothetical protein
MKGRTQLNKEMKMRSNRLLAVVTMSVSLSSVALAQTKAKDPSERLKEVLPADVASRVLEKIAAARSHELPAAALENRALKAAARGVKPADIEKSVDDNIANMGKSKDALEKARGRKPADDEVEAGADVIRRGVDGARVSELAKSAPSGRSLAVPLFVVGSLMDRGLASDAALQKVQEKLAARASDRELEGMPGRSGDAAANKSAVTGQDLAATKKPTTTGAAAGRGAGGPPATVPANGGKGNRPTTPAKKPPME